MNKTAEPVGATIGSALAGATHGNTAIGTGATNVAANANLKFGTVSQTLSSMSIGAGATVIFTSGVARGAFSGSGSGEKALSISGDVSGSATVPKPGTLGLLLLGALGVMGRRRRASA